MTSDLAHPQHWPEPPPPAPRDDWFDRAAVGLALIAGGRIDIANAALAAFLRRRPDDLAGRPVDDHVHPDHRGRLAAALANANGPAEPLEIAWLRDGEPAWAITVVEGWRAGPSGRPRALVQVEDRDARAAAERALRRHAGQLRLAAGSAVLVLGDDAMPRHAIADVREVLGVPPEAALRRRWGVAMHPEDEALIRALLRAVRAEPGAVGHAHARLGDPAAGIWRDVDLTLVNARDDPDIAGVALSLRHRGTTPQETTDMSTHMPVNGMARADGEGRGLPHLAAVLRLVKHEFRTPLTSIRGYAELIAGLEPEQGDVGEFARIIDQEAGKLSTLIDELLLLDLLEAGEIELRAAPADLNGIVRELIRRLTLHDHPGGPEFRLNLDPLLPPALGDYDRLTQLVGNLVEHALRASPPGAEIDIRTASDGRAVRLAVSDLGGALSAEDRERMFDRFLRLDAASGRVLRSGLSLPIARGLALLHGGEIGADPRDGAGATVWVTLPVARGDAA